ncbi:hypothetical protein HK098_002410 [Nowakowskiella sp. JEL0407]|nr:hypothetical protein HK098_002410 [Nowakowskiella sp. JEL0407]
MSLGVGYLAKKVMLKLQQQNELGITNEDIQDVTIAGLCHDLGHGPYSHLFDRDFISKTEAGLEWKKENGKEWTHEVMSAKIFDYMIQINSIDIPHNRRERIKSLIFGDHSFGDKKFLMDIVANKRNEIDFDKIDYLHRDQKRCGDENISLLPFDIDGMPLKVINDHICYDISTKPGLINIFECRFNLFKYVYLRAEICAASQMLIDMLFEMNATLKISEYINDTPKYLTLTDKIFDLVLNTNDPTLEKARSIYQRYLSGNWYKVVFETVFEDREEMRDRIASCEDTELEISQRIMELSEGLIGSDDFKVVQRSKDQLLQWDRKPLNRVLFYDDRSTESHKVFVANDLGVSKPSSFQERIAVINFHRPQSKNALGKTLIGQLKEVIDNLRYANNDDARVVILRSMVSGVFCGGADLKERLLMTEDEVAQFVNTLRSTFNDLASIPIPTISAIDGAALGGGLEVALATDIRIAGKDAKFGLPETKLGIIPGAGGTQRVPRLIGVSKAKELIFTGKILNAQDAENIGMAISIFIMSNSKLFTTGLVNQVVQNVSAFEKSLEIAQEIKKRGPIALKLAKTAIDDGLRMDM